MVWIGSCYSRCSELRYAPRSILSPWLFTVFVNDLVSILRTAQVGAVVSGVHSGSPMYADDLTTISRLKNGLDKMLDLLFDYGLTWRITFNQTKTVTMVFGEKTADRQVNVASRKCMVSW